MDLFQLLSSPDINWWTGVDYCEVLSAVWTLILTAPIHCRASISEQVMQCYISANLKVMGRSWTIRSIETNL